MIYVLVDSRILLVCLLDGKKGYKDMEAYLARFSDEEKAEICREVVGGAPMAGQFTLLMVLFLSTVDYLVDNLLVAALGFLPGSVTVTVAVESSAAYQRPEDERQSAEGGQ